MLCKNRQLEVRQDIVEHLKKNFNSPAKILPLHNKVEEELYLEGTGSMILDRENHICYACISPRTNLILLNEFCEKMNYKLIHFKAIDQKKVEIYHTNGNVMFMLFI